MMRTTEKTSRREFPGRNTCRNQPIPAPRSWDRATSLVVAATLLLPFSGCASTEDRAARDLREEARAVLEPTNDAERAPERAHEHDLRTAHQTYGDDAIYTLQIGVYGRTDGARPSADELRAFRQAAEQAVRELRRDGEIAFYYHGPIRSTITVGVFGEDDHDPEFVPPIESATLRDTRARFPHNLVNGAGVRETIRTTSGPKERIQPSALVAIPRSRP